MQQALNQDRQVQIKGTMLDISLICGWVILFFCFVGLLFFFFNLWPCFVKYFNFWKYTIAIIWNVFVPITKWPGNHSDPNTGGLMCKTQNKGMPWIVWI